MLADAALGGAAQLRLAHAAERDRDLAAAVHVLDVAVLRITAHGVADKSLGAPQEALAIG
jgi:hypothetical protein